ncbi:MAG: hypothetical protein AAFQ98_17990 [Bacteroidota bacterium]
MWIPFILATLLVIWLCLEVVDGPLVRLFVVPAWAFVMANWAKAIRSKMQGAGAGYVMKGSELRPILYLRSSATDEAPGVAEAKFNYHLGKSAKMAEAHQSQIYVRLKQYAPPIALAGPTDERHFASPSRFNRMEDEEWQTLVSALMKISWCCVFLVDKVTQNLYWELAQAQKWMPKSYFFFYVYTSDEGEKTKVMEFLAKAGESMDCSAPEALLSYKRSGHWFIPEGDQLVQVKTQVMEDRLRQLE